MDFYKHLNYSIGNEDWHTEQQALRVNKGDTVVCVTASGDRPLHLLMTDCKEVISIDSNRIQNYLLMLKIAALVKLDYEKYLAFLGCTATPFRWEIFQEIKSYLPHDVAHFWENHKKMIVRGVIYQGITERFSKSTSRVFKLIRRNKIATLFSFQDIESQREYVTHHWDTFLLRKIFEIFSNPKLIKFAVNDPGLTTFIDISIKPGKYIYQRMLKYLNKHLARKSALLQLLFMGHVLPEAYFPYLTFSGYTKIRSNVHKLNYHTDNILNFLNKHEPNSIDCFSLSDIASYMPQKSFEELLHAIAHSAKPNARFCIREFLSKRSIPTKLKIIFDRNLQLEDKIEYEESNFVYRFLAGDIKKKGL